MESFIEAEAFGSAVVWSLLRWFGEDVGARGRWPVTLDRYSHLYDDPEDLADLMDTRYGAAKPDSGDALDLELKREKPPDQRIQKFQPS